MVMMKFFYRYQPLQSSLIVCVVNVTRKKTALPLWSYYVRCWSYSTYQVIAVYWLPSLLNMWHVIRICIYWCCTYMYNHVFLERKLVEMFIFVILKPPIQKGSCYTEIFSIFYIGHLHKNEDNINFIWLHADLRVPDPILKPKTLAEE